jgi:hypothetical protein
MSKNRLKVALSGICIAPVMVAIAFATVNAQGAPGQISNSPLDAILIKLDQMLAVLNQMNPQAGPDPVVLTTPWLSTASGDLVSCPILNVGTTTLTDVSANISDTGGQNTGGFAFPNGLAPRAATNAAAAVGARGLPVRCEFAFKGGSAASVRANLVIKTSSGILLGSADAR